MTMNFKSKGAEKKYMAYKAIHMPGCKSHQKVTIGGKAHKVDHGFYGHMIPEQAGKKICIHGCDD